MNLVNDIWDKNTQKHILNFFFFETHNFLAENLKNFKTFREVCLPSNSRSISSSTLSLFAAAESHRIIIFRDNGSEKTKRDHEALHCSSSYLLPVESETFSSSRPSTAAARKRIKHTKHT